MGLARTFVPGLTLLVGLSCSVGAETSSSTTFGPAPGENPEPMTTTGAQEDSTTFAEVEESSDGFFTTGTVDDGTTGMVDDGTTDDDAGEDSSGDDGGSVDVCVNTTTCPAAAVIGGVSGDTSSASLLETGTEPVWLAFQVSEDDSDIEGASMSFTATLTSPPGADFDLYVYRSVEGGVSGCSGFLQQATTLGLDVVTMNWGEGLVANGIDDDVWVAVEIVAKTDVCAPPQEWTLTVQGDT